ncbi:MAG: S-methyl-5'-thioinosine phosphorylase [Candidatus Bathyarchaeia archaeon]
MTPIGLIGGTGLETLLESAEEKHRRTPYGVVDFYEGKLDEKTVIFVSRHGIGHTRPPHKVLYKANIWLLNKFGVERIVALNAVGAINQGINLGDLVVPHDFIDFTKSRPSTFYDTSPVTHVDMSVPYCPEIRNAIIKAAKQSERKAHEKAVMVCTEGPRFETPSEITMFKKFGADVVGMTGVPEVSLARELGMCYASLCFASNRAAGMQKRLTTSEVLSLAKSSIPVFRQVIPGAIDLIPVKRGCTCGRALEGARI